MSSTGPDGKYCKVLCFSSRVCSWSPILHLSHLFWELQMRIQPFLHPLNCFPPCQQAVYCSVSREGRACGDTSRWDLSWSGSAPGPGCLSSMGWAESHWAPWFQYSSAISLAFFKSKASNLQIYCWGIQPLHCNLPASVLPRSHKLCKKSLELLTLALLIKLTWNFCWSACLGGSSADAGPVCVSLCMHPVSSKLFLPWSCLFSLRHFGWASEAKIAHVIDAWTWNSNQSPPPAPCKMESHFVDVHSWPHSIIP